MTIFVGTLAREDLGFLLKDLEEISHLPFSERPDLLEVRFDALPSLSRSTIEEVLARSPLPVLVTIRPKRESGRFQGTEDERRELLLEALRRGAPFLDVEGSTPQAEELLREAQRRGVRVVYSWHPRKRVTSDEILDFLRRASHEGAWVGKVALQGSSREDLEILVESSSRAREEGLLFSLMSSKDSFFRRVAGALGSTLVYVRVGEGIPEAPGQLPLSKVAPLHRISRRRSGSLRTAFLLGKSLPHSFSPLLHEEAFRITGFDGAYVPLALEESALLEAVALFRSTPSFLGANVTMPHKIRIVPLLDELDPISRRVGCVNVVAPREGHLVGYNTDGEGALCALRERSCEISGKSALVLGAGGTARSIAFALFDEGCALTVCARRVEEAEKWASTLGARVASWKKRGDLLEECEIVVQATPLGLKEGEDPLEGIDLPPRRTLLEAPYRVGGTLLSRRARQAHWSVVPGGALLLHQGVASFRIWTGTEPPLGPLRRALESQGVEV